MSENCTYVQKVISIPKTSIIQEQTNDNVVKMLIELPGGDQRLVAFNIPVENITVQDLLLEAGITADAETDVSLVEDPTALQIHYIVEVLDSKSNKEIGVTGFSVQFPNNSNSSTSQIEVPKYVDGKLAVCPHCGFLSSTFHRCERCKRKLPENVKSVIDNYSMKEPKKLCKDNDNPLAKAVQPATKKRSISEEKISQKPEEIQTTEEKAKECTEISTNEEIANEDGIEEVFEDGFDSYEEFSEYFESSDYLEGFIHTSLSCRTVRIGSYKFFPQEKIIISQQGLRLNVPSLEDEKKIVKVNIRYEDIIRAMIHFGRNLPVIFFITSTRIGAKIRQILGMKNKKNPYYDPASEDLTQKRITILPVSISEESQDALKKIFASKFEELNMTQANEILVKSSPREPTRKYPVTKVFVPGQGYVKYDGKHTPKI